MARSNFSGAMLGSIPRAFCFFCFRFLSGTLRRAFGNLTAPLCGGHGLAVTVEYTRGSVDMVKRLTAGTAKIALTSVDNVIAYASGHGEAEGNNALDLIAFMGGDRGFLSLVARPEGGGSDSFHPRCHEGDCGPPGLRRPSISDRCKKRVPLVAA